MTGEENFKQDNYISSSGEEGYLFNRSFVIFAVL